MSQIDVSIAQFLCQDNAQRDAASWRIASSACGQERPDLDVRHRANKERREEEIGGELEEDENHDEKHSNTL